MLRAKGRGHLLSLREVGSNSLPASRAVYFVLHDLAADCRLVALRALHVHPPLKKKKYAPTAITNRQIAPQKSISFMAHPRSFYANVGGGDCFSPLRLPLRCTSVAVHKSRCNRVCRCTYPFQKGAHIRTHRTYCRGYM